MKVDPIENYATLAIAARWLNGDTSNRAVIRSAIELIKRFTLAANRNRD